MKVWSIQSKEILQSLEIAGVHHAEDVYIEKNLGDIFDIYMVAYSWLGKAAHGLVKRPVGAKLPIWVAVTPQHLPKDNKDDILLHLDIPDAEIIIFNFDTWSQILNYGYIAADENDLNAHRAVLKNMGISDDTKAFLTPFYPLMKEKIIKSWSFLLEEKEIPFEKQVGIIWEVKKEWIVKIDK